MFKDEFMYEYAYVEEPIIVKNDKVEKEEKRGVEIIDLMGFVNTYDITFSED